MATNGWVKHREERRRYSIDYTADLAGDSITGVAELLIQNESGEDVSDEFLDPGDPPASTASEVKFWMRAAAADGEQAVGNYFVKAVVTTAQGNQIVALTELNGYPLFRVVDP